MTLADGFRSIGEGFQSILAPVQGYEERIARLDERLGYPSRHCSAWYGHRYVYGHGELVCVNCGDHHATKSLKPKVAPCHAWNGHMYTVLPRSAHSYTGDLIYCPICLSRYVRA